MQPENAIAIKPFTSAEDVDDTALLDLIPFLRALATEGVEDYREVLKEYHGKDIGVEYKKKLEEVRIINHSYFDAYCYN